MTEQTIRHTAKEFAGTWYESNSRSEEFRNGTMRTKVYRTLRVKVGNTWVEKEVEFLVPMRVAFPNVEAYVKSAWPHWVDYAREKLAEMLGMPDAKVSPIMKERIFAALVEDRERQLKGAGKHVRQLRGPDEECRGFGFRGQ